MTDAITWVRHTRRAVFGATLVLGVGCGWLLVPSGDQDPPRADSPADASPVASLAALSSPDASVELRVARIHRDVVLADRDLGRALSAALDPRAADTVLVALHHRLLDRARAMPTPSDAALRGDAAAAAAAVRRDPTGWLAASGLLTVNEDDVSEWTDAFLDALWDDPPSATVLEWSDARCRLVHARAETLARERLQGLRGGTFASLAAKDRALARALEGLRHELFAAPAEQPVSGGAGS